MSWWWLGVTRSVSYFLLIRVFSIPFRFLLKSNCSKTKSGCKSILDKTTTIVHKGGIPENTIEGIRRSKAKGASSIEVDAQFTKDGHLVLLHDETVDRTSNGKGQISSLTLNEAKLLDFGNKDYPNCRIPTATELFATIKELDLIVFLEIKLSPKKNMAKIAEMFKKDSSLYHRVVVISFYPDLLHQIMLLDPNIVVGLSVHGALFSECQTEKINVIERIFLWLSTRVIPKLLGTNLLILQKDNLFLNRVNYYELIERGSHIITYELKSKEEVERCEKDHIPFIINEDLFLEI